MDGLTKEQQTRLSLIICLEPDQKDYILSGILALLDNHLKYDKVSFTRKEVAEELINDIDTMIAKAYEKGRYL